MGPAAPASASSPSQRPPTAVGLVEAALTAALVAAGVRASHVLTGVLVYRLVNFWLVLAVGLACSPYRTGVLSPRMHPPDRHGRVACPQPGQGHCPGGPIRRWPETGGWHHAEVTGRARLPKGRYAQRVRPATGVADRRLQVGHLEFLRKPGQKDGVAEPTLAAAGLRASELALAGAAPPAHTVASYKRR